VEKARGTTSEFSCTRYALRRLQSINLLTVNVINVAYNVANSATEKITYTVTPSSETHLFHSYCVKNTNYARKIVISLIF